MTHPGVLLKSSNLFAGKEMGQNFLSNPQTARMIVDKSGIREQDHILEIGPGLGALTLFLAEKADFVTAVEKDTRIIPLLEQEIEAGGFRNVRIIQSDFLKFDLKTIFTGRGAFQQNDAGLVVMGNLPYNISSQILFKLIENRHLIDRACLMFQKELAERILAPPETRDYSRLSAVAQYASEIKSIADIGAASFFPRPKVDSTILEFCFHTGKKELDKELERILFSVIKAAFSKRRKSLKNSMAGGEFGLTKEFCLQVLESAGIDPSRRAETLGVEEFIKIAENVHQIGGNDWANDGRMTAAD